MLKFWTSATLLLLISILQDSCGFSSGTAPATRIQFGAPLREFTDTEYPDNPDLELRDSGYVKNRLSEILLVETENGLFDLICTPESPGDDTFRLRQLDLLEFMPAMPATVRGDSFLIRVALTNQEWNRNQVSFPTDVYWGNKRISRCDLARNCLNAGLWELHLFTPATDGTERITYHGWFDFPMNEYAKLFERRNQGESFSAHRAYLEKWIAPAAEKVDFSKLRTVVSEQAQAFQSLNMENYPLKGERAKKQKNILFPTKWSKIADFQTDSALFATFSPPGIYSRSDPRHTQLGRFASLEKVVRRQTRHLDRMPERTEFQLDFSDLQGRATKLWMGGIDLSLLPVLPSEEANSGQMYSMGIGNHPFYEKYDAHLAENAAENPRFILLTDGENRFLESHEVGIDGVLLHRDPSGEGLHLWLLAFERHALVGHYFFQIPK